MSSIEGGRATLPGTLEPEASTSEVVFEKEKKISEIYQQLSFYETSNFE